MLIFQSAEMLLAEQPTLLPTIDYHCYSGDWMYLILWSYSGNNISMVLPLSIEH